jgi:hypothetical protein
MMSGGLQSYRRSSFGSLAILATADGHERDCMWDLIWVMPITMNGLAALLRYCRENESINELVHRDEGGMPSNGR